MDHLIEFKKQRKQLRKDNLSLTLSRVRTENLETQIIKTYPFVKDFNQSEKIEFMLYVLENLMFHFGYPDMVKSSDLPPEKIHEIEGIK